MPLSAAARVLLSGVERWEFWYRASSRCSQAMAMPSGDPAALIVICIVCEIMTVRPRIITVVRTVDLMGGP